jgi:hypothetical protein
VKCQYASLMAGLSLFLTLAAYSQIPVVSKDGLSVHRIERGDMPIVAPLPIAELCDTACCQALIQAVSGLDPGDRVIVTDMSQWEKAERVKLE